VDVRGIDYSKRSAKEFVFKKKPYYLARLFVHVPPLCGITVLDLTRAMAGPFATMLLADFGAEVIKVEPLSGDETRMWGPPFVDGQSTYFLSVNRNKKSVCVDLRSEEGKNIVRKLASSCDVLIENFRPGVVNAMNLDYDSVSKINPKVVYCSISGFGESGPWSSKPGYDLVALAESGMMHLTGEPDGEPVKFAVPVADISAGLFAAFSIACALYRRQIDGKGEYIEVSLYESMLYMLTHQAQAFLSAHEKPKRLGSAHPSIAPYRAYRAMDGYLVVCVGNDSLWKKLCEAIGKTELCETQEFLTNPLRVKNREKLDSVLQSIFEKDTVDAWIRKLEASGVPCAKVRDIEEALLNPHAKEREVIQRISHPLLKELDVVFSPPRLKNNPAALSSPPPLLGSHTLEVLLKLGYTQNEVKELESKGVVKLATPL
jgi:crotonobetainyl-CoA:carnitine CoA-transferase CaiB-like acyl-CoA transferase